jgi:hypothetical protein
MRTLKTSLRVSVIALLGITGVYSVQFTALNEALAMPASVSNSPQVTNIHKCRQHQAGDYSDCRKTCGVCRSPNGTGMWQNGQCVSCSCIK